MRIWEKVEVKPERRNELPSYGGEEEAFDSASMKSRYAKTLCL